MHMGSQVKDSVSPPRVVVRREAVPLWLRDMQDTMGTSPAPVAASQMSTIPGMSLELLSPDYAPSLAPQRALSVSQERQGPQELQASQGSVEMRASAEFERSRSRDLQRQPAIVPRERRPVALLTAVPTEIVLKMTSLQDELRQAQVNLAVQTARNEVQAARQEVAESKLDLLTQQTQWLGQQKDEWNRQVGSMQAEHRQQVETQRYEVAAAAPARAGGDDEGAPLPAAPARAGDDDEGAPLPAFWLHHASFVNSHSRLVHCLTQVVTFSGTPHSSFAPYMTRDLAPSHHRSTSTTRRMMFSRFCRCCITACGTAIKYMEEKTKRNRQGSCAQCKCERSRTVGC